MNEITNKIKAVMLGHAVADALGVPVEFNKRKDLDKAPVTDMYGYGTYPVPAGAWSDDTSMSLAALDSIAGGTINWDDVMEGFGAWYYRDKYTPTGKCSTSATPAAKLFTIISDSVKLPQNAGLATDAQTATDLL